MFVDRDAWFSVGPGARLTIADNAHINRGFVVSCAGHVSIGRNVVMADRVFIGDTNHGYEDVSTPILHQPMSPPRRVVIEDDCWLGINVCVLSGVTIGRHSVIGANSVVTRDVPPFAVCVRQSRCCREAVRRDVEAMDADRWASCGARLSRWGAT